MQLAILAAGKPGSGSRPSAVENVLSGMSSTKWTASVVNRVGMKFQIVGGYKIEDLRDAFPEAILQVNLNWRNSGSIGSFFRLDLGASETLLVTYSDIVFSRRLVEDMAAVEADLVVAWDSQFSAKHEEKNHELEQVFVKDGTVIASGQKLETSVNVGFFPGIMKFSPRTFEKISLMPESEVTRLSEFHMSELINYLLKEGTDVRAVECNGEWARIEKSDELVRFVLGSKADTLVRLEPLLKESEIPSSLVFKVKEWLARKHTVLAAISAKWPHREIVIRSSARAEDTFEESMAGAFTSVVGVSGKEAVIEAIEEVIGSYADGNPENQVLVQPLVKNLIANGVVFTRSLGGHAPWLIINFELSDRSDGVTSGRSRTARTLSIFRPTAEHWLLKAKSNAVIDNLPSWIPSLLEAVRELEDITHYSRLDIEFGVDADGRIYTFQVRPLASNNAIEVPDDREFETALEQARRQWDDSPAGGDAGDSDSLYIFSNMTDWNPAEILGAAPKQLAVSLYEELITNRVWADSRAYFGYRKLSDRPLLKDIAGRPYVDVAASIESLLPGKLPNEQCAALLGFFLNWLNLHPDQHDKVEFEVVPTCLTPKFPNWAERLADIGGFEQTLIENYRDSLRGITREAIRSINKDFELVAILDQKCEQVSGDPRVSRADKVTQVLEICQQYGTFPFSNLARRAFVAVTLLKDAAGAGIVSSAAVDDFLATIRTVSHRFGADAGAVRSGSMSWDDFVSTYGHLRPGTYDIKSPRYDSEPQRFLRPLVDGSKEESDEKVAGFRWATERYALFEWVRRELGEFSDDEIENFLRTAIEGRESAKFSFTRLLSWVLEEVKELARDWDVSVDNMSHLRLEQILEAATENQITPSSRKKLVEISDENRKAHELACQIKLPGFISKSDHLFAFVTGHEVPNFVGNTSIINTLVHLASGEIELGALTGKIVLIEAADPGFDWIFGHDIAGLVTKYGGANSHMAIRAAEFGLPAAIGVGDSLFDELVKKKTIELDPTNHIVRGLS